MNLPEYIGPTPITEYGCVKCQRYHRKELDAEYDEHLHYQSKHGIRTRMPITLAEKFAAEMEHGK